MPPTLLTLGHGTSGEDELAALIRSAGVELIVDVRTVPKSRRYPQFRCEEMESWIPALSGSAYLWEPALGGFRKTSASSINIALRNPSFRGFADYMETESFASALEHLLQQVTSKRTAVLCSESLWWRCHRRLIADAALLAHGVAVDHLMHDGSRRPHIPTSGVRVAAGGSLRYDLLFQADDAPVR